MLNHLLRELEKLYAHKMVEFEECAKQLRAKLLAHLRHLLDELNIQTKPKNPHLKATLLKKLPTGKPSISSIDQVYKHKNDPPHKLKPHSTPRIPFIPNISVIYKATEIPQHECSQYHIRSQS